MAPWTLADLAAEISALSGRDIPLSQTWASQVDYAAALVGAGRRSPLAEMIAGWDVDAAKARFMIDTRRRG